jgi:hypothetical protein
MMGPSSHQKSPVGAKVPIDRTWSEDFIGQESGYLKQGINEYRCHNPKTFHAPNQTL